ncbi:glycosyltransferase family 2 protein [Arcticibacter sp. MXS-1]|uniref:glycosyltransferase family 2 protein n=1 Tax=Arcticibacter sp. MXS-1 TaxID=3341726 RepID=UPI0035A879B3
MKQQVTASIVLYNTDASVKKTIESFLACSLHVKLYLIDNSPGDTLRSLASDPRVEYIHSGANLGFGRAHNVAVREVIDSSPYHLVLNPDISFERGVIEELYTFMEKNRGVGHVMPKVYYPDGSTQYLCKLIPTPFDLIFKRFLPASFSDKRMERFQLRSSGYNKEMDVPYLSGCFMFLRTSALREVGLFDERFFMYPEDIDLTRRIHRKYRTVFYPEVSVIHAHAAESYKSFRMLYIHIANMVRYFNKWGWLFDAERRRINQNILSKVKNNEG